MSRKILRFVILMLPITALILYGVYQQLQRYADEPLLITEETLFTLPAGTGRIALEQQLIRQRILASSTKFQSLLKIEPELAKFKAGTYRLSPGITLRQLLLLLRSGKEAQFTIRFIEGWRLQDWLATLQSAPYLKSTLSGQTVEQISTRLSKGDLSFAEGWLYPDTYLYTAGTADETILSRAYQRMQSELQQVWQGRAAELPYTTPEQLLIMASIIEKETAIDSERATIASVFINRLRRGMRLQTDPTVIYGMQENYNGTLSRKDLEIFTPYNTYKINGLPPTPIAMPSQASLQAAAHPALTDYLYFVADGRGGHVFSLNLPSHNQAVRDYLKRRKDQREE